MISEVAKKIAKEIGISIDKKSIEEHKLDGNHTAPYYLYFYWGSGSGGEFGDIENIRQALIDNMTSDHESSFRLFVYDTKTAEDISNDFTVTLSVKRK